MIVNIKTPSESLVESRDYRAFYVLLVDGKEIFSVYDGEPEDNSIGRNFNDVYNIPKLMRMAFDAGKSGEEFNLIHTKVDDDEDM